MNCRTFRPKRIVLAICCLCLVTACREGFAFDLDKAKAYFLKGDYQDCINECERILADAQYSKKLDELYLLLGLSYSKEGRLLRASDIFEIIINEFKDSRFTEQAYLGLGDVYLLKSDYGNAEKNYKQIVSLNPNSKLKSLVLFRLAQCAIKQGDWQKAKEYLDNLNRQYPLSPERRPAQHLTQEKFYFTVQVGAFSNIVNAENLYAELNNKGYPAYIEKIEAQAKPTYRVRVGRLSTPEQARHLQERLKREGYPTKIFP